MFNYNLEVDWMLSPSILFYSLSRYSASIRVPIVIDGKQKKLRLIFQRTSIVSRIASNIGENINKIICLIKEKNARTWRVLQSAPRANRRRGASAYL